MRRTKGVRRRKSRVILLFLSLCLSTAHAQVNLSGKPGLLYVPSAVESPDGAFRVGVAYNPVRYGLRRPGRNAERILYANLTVLPRLEVNINFLQLIGTDQYPVREGLGDRQLDLRYVLLRETARRPAVAVVLSSPFTIDAALLTHVVVATKTFDIAPDLRALVTAGVGSPYFVYRDVKNLQNYSILQGFRWQKKSEYRYNNHYLVGPFGGVQVEYKQRVGLMVEYDSQHINAGAYATLWGRWNVQAGLIDFSQVTAGTSYVFPLLHPSRRTKQLYENVP